MVKPRRLGALMALAPIAIGILLFSTLQLSLASLAEKNDMEGRMAFLVKRNVDKGPPTPKEQKSLKEIDDYLQGKEFRHFYKALERMGGAEPYMYAQTTDDYRTLKTAHDFDRITENVRNVTVGVSLVQLAQTKLEMLVPYRKYLPQTGPELDKMLQVCQAAKEAFENLLLYTVPELSSKLLMSGIDAGLMQEFWKRIPLTFERSGAGGSAEAGGSIGPVELAKLFKMPEDPIWDH